MRITTRLVLALLICAAAHAGQPKWILMQNENFRVYSSANEHDTREVLNQFELIRGFFNQITGAKPEKVEPVPVIVFGTDKEYQPFRFNDFATAYYAKHSDLDFIVVGKLDDQSRQTASHEYTHLEFAHAGYTLPPWLNEGIADLFSTLRSQGEFTLYGDILPGRLQELGRQKWVPLQTILAADQTSPYYNESSKAGSLYNESWALVHMLATSEGYRDKFWGLVNAVNGGAPSVEALEKTYGTPFAKLEDTLRSYIEGNRFYQIKVKVALGGAEKLTSQPADLFEVHELQAALLMGLKDRQEEARTRLEELTHEDATRPGPWANLGYLAWRGGDRDKAVEYFGKAYDLGNRRPRMLTDYAHLVASSNRERSIEVLQANLRSQPENVDARLFLGSLLMSLDRFEEALAATRPITAVGSLQQRDDLLYLRAFASMRLSDYATARMLAEKLKSSTTSESVRSRAEDILRVTAQHQPSTR
jgi:tetratricopeptide (TPR) repeat protein